MIEGRLTGIQDQLTGVGTRLTGVEGRLTLVEDKLTDVDVRLTGVDVRLTGVEGRLTGVESGLAELGHQMRVLHEDTIDTIKALAPDFGPVRREFTEADDRLREGIDRRLTPLETWVRARGRDNNA